MHRPHKHFGALPTARAILAAAALAALGLPPASAQDAGKFSGRVALAQSKPAPKPAIAPAKPAPATIPGSVAETAPAPAPAAAPEQSSLAGAWRINWLRLNKATALNISGERGQPGIVGFDGVLTSLAGAECKGGGFAAKTLGGVFPSGGDVNMVGVADYARIITQCASGQVWLEALGVAGKPLQWVGRAVMIDAAGARSFESFVLTR